MALLPWLLLMPPTSCPAGGGEIPAVMPYYVSLTAKTLPCYLLLLQAGESAMEDGDAANGAAAEEAPSQPPPPPSGLPEVET